MSDESLAALRARREQISREIKDLSAEDAELAVAEQVFRRLASGMSPAAITAAGRVEPARRPSTQREYVLWALKAAAKPWLSASEILEAVRAHWGVSIPERSLRPLLSNMKQDGDIVRAGRVVAAPGRAREGSPRVKDRA